MTSRFTHLCVFLVLVLLVSPLWASQTRYVVGFGTDSGNDCTDQNVPCQTITHAISQSSSGDTIAIFAGTYTIETLSLYNRQLNFLGQGAGPGGTVIQVQGGGPTEAVGRILNLQGGSDIEVNRIWLRHGNSGTDNGGGIALSGSKLTLIDSLLSDNRGGAGGGIHLINQSELIVDNSEIQGNYADNDGGAIRAVGGSTIDIRNGSRILENEAGTHGGGIAVYSTTSLLIHGGSQVSGNRAEISGGGITSGNPQGFNGGQVTLLDASISDNIVDGFGSRQGGGILIRNGEVEMQGTRIENNFAEGWGGGIAHSLGSLTMREVTVVGNESAANAGGVTIGLGSTVSIGNSTIMNNRATGPSGVGGGIRLGGDSEVVIFNSTITGNTSWAGAGLEVFLSDGSLDLLHATITNNEATGSSAAVRFNQQEGVTVNVGNTLIADQRGQTLDCDGEAPSIGNNLSSDDSCGFSNGTDIENGNAGLLPLFDNGGPTLTHALRPESDAVGTANITTCTDAPVFGEDQRYENRPQNTFCDIGAYELGTLALQFAVTSLPQAAWNEAYTFQFQAAGGEPPYTWSLTSIGGLPQGLEFDWQTGEISGTPTAIGSFELTFMVSDGMNFVERDFVLTIDGPDSIFSDRFSEN